MGMTDRELLEAAAKAAGINADWGDKFDIGGDEVDCTDMLFIFGDDGRTNEVWNPLTDDGDALRLAVKLQLQIDFADEAAWANGPEPLQDYQLYEWHGGDMFAATRRAIVRAAAALPPLVQAAAFR